MLLCRLPRKDIGERGLYAISSLLSVAPDVLQAWLLVYGVYPFYFSATT